MRGPRGARIILIVPHDPEAYLHPAIQQRIAEVDTAGRAVIATEPDGRIVYWNEEAELLYGWSASEILGRNIIDVTPTELARDDAAEVMNTLNQGRSWSGEFLVRGKDGSRFAVHVIDIPVSDEHGTLVGIVGLSHRAAYLGR